MSRIYKLSMRFRYAIGQANNERLFNRDSFSYFPRGCCGDASDLLAQYLLEHGIITETGGQVQCLTDFRSLRQAIFQFKSSLYPM